VLALALGIATLYVFGRIIKPRNILVPSLLWWALSGACFLLVALEVRMWRQSVPGTLFWAGLWLLVATYGTLMLGKESRTR
jgi:hypothetical protein